MVSRRRHDGDVARQANFAANGSTSRADKRAAVSRVCAERRSGIRNVLGQLEHAIGGIREATDDNAAAPRLIHTVKRTRYRFVGAVDGSGAPPPRDALRLRRLAARPMRSRAPRLEAAIAE